MNLNAPKDPKEMAEARIRRKELQAQEGVQAWKDYVADGIETRANMARLRAQRLAKEAADRAAADAAPPEPVKPARKSRAKATAHYALPIGIQTRRPQPGGAIVLRILHRHNAPARRRGRRRCVRSKAAG